jgi:hypothetical protein
MTARKKTGTYTQICKDKNSPGSPEEANLSPTEPLMRIQLKLLPELQP